MFAHPHKPHLEDDCPPVAWVEPYRDAHHDAFSALIQKRYAESDIPFDQAALSQKLADIDIDWRRPGGECVMLFHKRGLIGSLAARPLKEKGRAEFDWFCVDPDFEGKGYSGPLYRWALEWCTRRDIEIVELWSGDWRVRAHHLYRKLGFVAPGVKKPMKSGHEAFYFELHITPALLNRLKNRFDRLP